MPGRPIYRCRAVEQLPAPAFPFASVTAFASLRVAHSSWSGPIDKGTNREHYWSVRSSCWSQAMAEITYYVALPFVAADDGVAAGEPLECFNPVAVVMRAEALSRKEGHVGAVAFSRTGDPATGDFSDAKVIRKFGNVPDDLSAL
jgi:hypothetical protein